MSDQVRSDMRPRANTLRQSRIFELSDFGNHFTFLSFASSSVVVLQIPRIFVSPRQPSRIPIAKARGSRLALTLADAEAATPRLAHGYHDLIKPGEIIVGSLAGMVLRVLSL